MKQKNKETYENEDDEISIQEEEGMSIENLNKEDLMESFNQNPFSLDIVIKLLSIYKSEDNWPSSKELLLKANKNIYFPEIIWQDWIDKEIENASTNEEKKEILKLFEKSLEDFEFFDIAKNYAKYSIQLFTIGLIRKNNIKIIFEKLISRFCNDFNKGSKFFRKSIKFETKLLKFIENDEKQKNESIKTIRNLYHRQLKLPFADIDITYDSYKEFETDESELSKGKLLYEQTYSSLEKWLNFEEEFQETLDSKNIEIIIKFLNSLIEKEIPKDRQLNYYERTLDEFPYEKEIWNLYLNIVKTEFKKPNQLYKYFKRANKCCPDDLEYARKTLRILGNLNDIEPSEYENEFQKFLTCFNDINDHYILWDIYCENQIKKLNETALITHNQGKKIEINSNSSKIDKNTIIQTRDCFSRAIDFFETKYNPKKSELFIRQFISLWSHIETYILKNKQEMNKIMEKYVKLYGNQSDSWILYINNEISFNDVSNSKSLLKRAVEYVKEGKEEILRWNLSFEKKFGDIESIEEAENKLSEYLLQNIEIEQIEQVVETKKHQRTKNNKNDKNQPIIKRKSLLGKRKHIDIDDNNDENEEKQTNLKKVHKSENTEKKQVFLDTKNTVYIRNFPLSFSEDDLKDIFPNKHDILECRLIKDKKNISKGFAYIDFVTPESANESLMINGKIFENRKIYAALSEPPKITHDDKKTLFLNNLPFSITEDSLNEAVPDYKNNIIEIRIIKDQNNKPKGYAYIEFDNEDNLTSFYEKYHKNLSINSKKIEITYAESNKNLNKARNSVIILKNLAFQVQESDIQNFFKELNIKQMELVKNKRGESRGFAFVEFESLSDLGKALDMKKGMLHDREFTIEKSLRELTIKKTDHTEQKARLGGGSLSKKDAVSNLETVVEKKEETQHKPKTNEDFRKMFLRK